MHHFMLADLLASLGAVGIYPLFILIPGYVLGWWLDLFDFRRRTAAFRLALSLPLAISVCPIAVYLAGRFGSTAVVWCLFAVVWLLWVAHRFLTAAAPTGPRPLGSGGTPWRAATLLAAGWLVLVLFSSIDLQFGDRAYFPVPAFDYSVRAEFIHSISTTGLPPSNPFFFPGHAVPLRYHYFWLLFGSLVERTGAPVGIGPRHAWIGGTFWCGLGFMALVALYFRLFWYRGPANFQRRAVTGILLLGVTGLDILPTIFLWILHFSGMPQAVFPSLEWWNEQVDGFVWTGLWVAHHLAALIACFTAFLIFGEAARRDARCARRKIAYVVVGGAALASAAGCSIYVTLVFAGFLLVWTAITAAKKWFAETAILVLGGIAALAFCLPYALDLRGPGSGGALFAFWVRPFHPVDAFIQAAHASTARRFFFNGLLLPLNYFLELGFFFAAALLWWRRRRAQPSPLARAEIAVAAMVAVSITACTFVRSSVIGNNDLGWRGFLVAQFGLLLWAVDAIGDPLLLKQRRAQRAPLAILLALGALGTAYDVAILRFYPMLADAGIVAETPWMAPDLQCGRRNYAAREAYQWAAHTTSPRAVVQFDPHVGIEDTSALLYAERQIAAGDGACLTAFGGDAHACAAILAKLRQIYPSRGQPAPQTLSGICSNLPIDVLVAKDTDAVWRDPRSWVWNEKPLFANRFFRLFGCRG